MLIPRWSILFGEKTGRWGGWMYRQANARSKLRVPVIQNPASHGVLPALSRMFHREAPVAVSPEEATDLIAVED